MHDINAILFAVGETLEKLDVRAARGDVSSEALKQLKRLRELNVYGSLSAEHVAAVLGREGRADQAAAARRADGRVQREKL